MRRALVLLAAVGLLTSACGSGTEGTPTPAKQAKTTKTSTSHAPFHGERLDDGEVVKVAELDGIRLESPKDGRLRSNQVAVDVTDFGSADVVEAGSDQEYGAREDSTLIAFRLRVTAFADDLGQKVKATVSVDGRQRSLPEFEYAIGTEDQDTTLQYVVAVPNDRREVELELKYADLAQTFDLLEGERTGEQPDILYRSDDAPFVYVENLTPAKLAVANEDGEPGAYIVSVTRAELTYFAPELGDMPADKKNAWLVINYEPIGEGSLEFSPNAIGCVPPFNAFVVNDGTHDYPAVDKQSKVEEFSSDQRLAFEVPADLTTAKLTVKTPGFNCANAGEEEPFTATGEAAVDMTLPED